MESEGRNEPIVTVAPVASQLAVLSVAVVSSVTHSPTRKSAVDVASGRVIAHEQAFQRWYPASLTKLMTIYVVSRRSEPVR
jgi:D-alanyl-D-alanine carboxypeptidase